MKKPTKLRIATRGSQLALAQSKHVAALIEVQYPDISTELVVIQTTGDAIQDKNLSEIGGKGLFTKELEDGLRAHEVDIAVHSLKDVPAFLPDGMMLTCIPEREDARDAFVSLKYDTMDALPEGAVVGTSSTRRAAQLLSIRPDVKIVPFRGNVQTRMRKLEEGVADASFLAVAGLNRLGMQHVISEALNPKQMLPAVCQGALGLEICDNREDIAALLAPLEHMPALLCASAERAFLQTLEGSCKTPIAGYAWIEGGVLSFEGLVASLDGQHIFRTSRQGAIDDAAAMGNDAAKQLQSDAGHYIDW